MRYKINLKKTDELTAVFLPFLQMAPHTELEGYYDEKQNLMELNGHSPDITLYRTHLVNWYVKAKANHDNLAINTGCGEFFLGKADKKDTTVIKMDSLQLISELRHDTIHYSLSWQSQQHLSKLFAEGCRDHKGQD